MIRRILKKLRASSEQGPSPSARAPAQSTGHRTPTPEPKVEPQIPSSDEPRHLVLLKDDYCGYCERVVRAIDKLGLEVERIDTRADAQAARDHRTKTGRSTVPCLYIDEIPLFESDDIMDWLEAYGVAGGAGET